jgi:hypothetical protein
VGGQWTHFNLDKLAQNYPVLGSFYWRGRQQLIDCCITKLIRGDDQKVMMMTLYGYVIILTHHPALREYYMVMMMTNARFKCCNAICEIMSMNLGIEGDMIIIPKS